MKVNKIFFSLIAMLAMMLAACSSDDDYQWASVSGAQVYFGNTLPSTVELSADKGSFDVALSRIDDSEELTVALDVTKGEGSIFTVPASATFAAGEKEALITVSYNPSDVVYGNYENITIKVADESLTTNYGSSEYSFKAGATAWVDWDMGLYREDCMTTFFGVGNPIGEVMIQRNVIEEGMYRIVNAYGEAYEYNEEGDWDASQDYYVTINATDPEAVYVEKSNTGMDWTYGEVSIQSMVSFYLEKGKTLEAIRNEHPEYFGTLVDGVITMPAGSMLISMADYNDGGWYPSNSNGMFAVALPGSVIADYSAEVIYGGKFIDADDNIFTVANVTLGSDVASAKVIVVPGRGNVDDGVDAIVNGTAENIAEISASGEVRVPMSADAETGVYTLVVVTFDANGKERSSAGTSFNYSSGAPAEKWIEYGVGAFIYKHVFCNEDGSPAEDGPLMMYVSEDNANRFKISDVFMGVDFTFTVNDDHTVTFEDQYTGYTDGNGDLMVCDLHALYPGQFPTESYISNDTYYFNTAYYDNEGIWAWDRSEDNSNLEAFVIEGYVNGAKPHKAAARSIKKPFSVNKRGGKPFAACVLSVNNSVVLR